jgi:hypothetical protein
MSKQCRAHSASESSCDACFYYDENKRLEAIATTLRGELAALQDAYDAHLYGVGLERETLKQLGLVDEADDVNAGSWRNARAEKAEAERDTLARRVAELEVLVKCPREEDHLRIDALTAENGRLREALINAQVLLQAESVVHPDDAILTCCINRVDAALAGGGDPLACPGCGKNPCNGEPLAPGERPTDYVCDCCEDGRHRQTACEDRPPKPVAGADWRCACGWTRQHNGHCMACNKLVGAAPSEAADDELSVSEEMHLTAARCASGEHCWCYRTKGKRCCDCRVKANTARITKEPK